MPIDHKFLDRKRATIAAIEGRQTTMTAEQHEYEVSARMRPVEIMRGATSWEVRKAYAEIHGVFVTDVVARRLDVPDSWKPHLN